MNTQYLASLPTAKLGGMTDDEIEAARETLEVIIGISPEDLRPGVVMPSKMLAKRLLDQLNGECARKTHGSLRIAIERYISEHPIDQIVRSN